MTAQLRIQTALARFHAFFAELKAYFVEREEVLDQLALALLAREHVLLTGPPGTGKSQLANAVLRRIVDERTGEPSVFAKQVTESTVQTDLVGPVDFRTLMETGRTEHFTDEGILGSVHAFLDEIFDGRDMLLRSTLNLLNERELKEGQKVKRGSVECAVMTSNRTVSEITGESRELLLAFLDRIAFVAFVPRRFADPTQLERVLDVQIGGVRQTPLKAELTIQDLDVLQAAVERVYIGPELIQLLATLLRELDRSLRDAARADPEFIPTRYFSTRTAVRAGRLLRAAAIFEQRGEPPERVVASAAQLRSLALSLTLGGPPVEACKRLLADETDARERRQLTQLRTERELFERCLARLPVVDSAPPATPARLHTLHSELTRLAAERGETGLGELTKELSGLVEAGYAGTEASSELLRNAFDTLARRSLQARFGLEANPLELAEELDALAHELEGAGAERAMSMHLRERALERLAEGLPVTPHALLAYADLGDVAGGHPAASAPLEPTLADQLLLPLRRAHVLRVQLLGAGAAEPAGAAARWQQALEQALRWLANGWDERLRALLTETPLAPSLEGRLALLEPLLHELERDSHQLERLGTPRAALRERVVGRRLPFLLRSLVDGWERSGREAYVSELRQLMAALAKAGLADAVDRPALLRDLCLRLLAQEPLPAPFPERIDHDGYRAFRSHGPRQRVCSVLPELVLTLFGKPLELRHVGAAGLDVVRAELGALEPELRERIVDVDLGQVERNGAFLASWWSALLTEPEKDPALRVRELVQSRFFHALLEESALQRLRLEATLIAELFPTAEPRARALIGSLNDLEARAADALAAALEARTEAGWAR